MWHLILIKLAFDWMAIKIECRSKDKNHMLQCNHVDVAMQSCVICNLYESCNLGAIFPDLEFFTKVGV